ncbi:MAG: hypothetical protein NOM71_04725 [Archaeoglobi archaeon]|nr:hypothetical protein [Archaeoglobi archaeon]
MSEVRRTNMFIIEGCPALWELADSCAKMYNELNSERRLPEHRLPPWRWR